MQNKVRIGLLGVGLDTYWGQFEGLLPRLLAYQEEICAGIEQMDVEVVNVGMVDSPQKQGKVHYCSNRQMSNLYSCLFLLMLFRLQFCLLHSKLGSL